MFFPTSRRQLPMLGKIFIGWKDMCWSGTLYLWVRIVHAEISFQQNLDIFGSGLNTSKA